MIILTKFLHQPATLRISVNRQKFRELNTERGAIAESERMWVGLGWTWVIYVFLYYKFVIYTTYMYVRGEGRGSRARINYRLSSLIATDHFTRTSPFIFHASHNTRRSLFALKKIESARIVPDMYILSISNTNRLID